LSLSFLPACIDPSINTGCGMSAAVAVKANIVRAGSKLCDLRHTGAKGSPRELAPPCHDPWPGDAGVNSRSRMSALVRSVLGAR
jgi:hypothetical protein